MFEWFEGKKLGRIWCLSATLVDGIDGVCGMPKAVIYYCIALALVFLTVKLTVFENRPKSRIQHCERSELRLSGQKLIKKCQKWSILASFENLYLAVKQCY